VQQTRISKIFRGRAQIPEPPLLDPPLNTMNRAANCLTPALTYRYIERRSLIQLARSSSQDSWCRPAGRPCRCRCPPGRRRSHCHSDEYRADTELQTDTSHGSHLSFSRTSSKQYRI